jgi:SAM-dependent methyltransferase
MISSDPVPDYTPTSERHLPVDGEGSDTSLANVDHMIRYAYAAPFVVGKRVLDISCGTGYGTQFLAQQGAREVVGVDVDELAVTYASKFYAHPNVRFIQSDAHYVQSLEDASFDVIVSFETIEHLPNPRKFVIELKRLLKPDGQLFLSCPNDYRVTPWLSEFHLHKFRFSEFRELVLSSFSEAAFLGQHYCVSSLLVRPIAPALKAVRFEGYQHPLAKDFFEREYLENFSSIENADGYLAIVNVETSQLHNQASISQSAFQFMMRLLNETMPKSQRVDQLNHDLHQAQLELDRMTQIAAAAQSRIQAMETSKFWKLRSTWFQFKRKLGLPTQE